MSAEKIKIHVSDSIGPNEALLVPRMPTYDDMLVLLTHPEKMQQFAKQCLLIKNVREASDVNS